MYRVLNSKTKTITSAAGILAIASLVSGILGLFRDRLLAGTFGVGSELDVYYTAFRIPDFISTVLVMGAISAAIIPIFSEYLSRSHKEAWKFFSNLVNLFLLCLILISLGLIFFVPEIISVIAPGFKGAQKDSTVLLTRIMFLSPILLGISNIVSGILRVFKRFLITSLAPITYNLGIIFGILFFVPYLGLSGLAWGVVFGAFLHLLIQIPILISLGFKLKFSFDFKEPGFLKVFKLTIPRAIGLAAGQINLIVITAIGSTLSVGSIAVFSLANNLQKLPITLIAVSFSTAAFPFLAVYFSKQEKDKLLQQFYSVFKKIFFFVLPISALIFLLRVQIIRVVLGTGRFSWVDTQLTAACLGIFAFGVFAYSLSMLISKTFYAFQNTRIPATITLVSIAINIFLSYFFVWLLSFENLFKTLFTGILDLQNLTQVLVIGLPLALTVSGIIQLLLLLIFLEKRFEGFILKELLEPTLKILASTVLLLLVSYFIRQLIAGLVDMQTFLGILLQLLLSSFAGVLVYYLAIKKFDMLSIIKDNENS